MGDYYNRTRSPLSLALPGGRSVFVAPKGWISVDPADEGVPDLIAKVNAGDLVPSKLNASASQVAAPAPVTPVAPAPAPAVVAVPVEPPAVEQEPAQETAPEPSTEPTSENRKNRKGRY